MEKKEKGKIWKVCEAKKFWMGSPKSLKMIKQLNFPGSVYFIVKTALGTATKKKRQKAEKICIKLRSGRKGPEGQKDAERAKTPNNP